MDLSLIQKDILITLITLYHQHSRPIKGEDIAEVIQRNPGTIRNQMQALKALELVDGTNTSRTRLELVRRKPMPFPPEPLRSVGIAVTVRALARADRRRGRRGPWLRALDAAGLGFDS
jgi:hypothetical protein